MLMFQRCNALNKEQNYETMKSEFFTFRFMFSDSHFASQGTCTLHIVPEIHVQPLKREKVRKS